MKKTILAAVAMFLLASCGGNNKNIEPAETQPASETQTPTQTPTQTSAAGGLNDYFPIPANTNYHYESAAGDEYTQDVYVTYKNGNLIQRRAASATVLHTEVIKVENGEARLIYGDQHFYFYEDITSAEPILDMLLLKEPLIKGQKWTQDALGQCEITGMDIPVTTPAGNFTAMEVTTQFNDGRQPQREYYAKGVGLVKTAYSASDGGSIEISLVRIDKNAVLTVPVDFYYPDANEATGFGKEERDININTNCDLARLLNEQMKTAGSSGYVWLPGNTNINTIDIDRVNDIIILGFSDNEGVKTQSGLQSIADTLGNFYGADKVRPTVNGADYHADNKTYGPSDAITANIEPDPAAVS